MKKNIYLKYGAFKGISASVLESIPFAYNFGNRCKFVNASISGIRKHRRYKRIFRLHEIPSRRASNGAKRNEIARSYLSYRSYAMGAI